MIEFWLKSQEGEFKLPVPPPDYENLIEREIETVKTTGAGDINIARHKKLATMVITSFFPVRGYTFAKNPFYPPFYIERIKGWIEKDVIVRLVITDGSQTKLNQQYYVESIKLGEDHESNGDINYTLTLREYRRPEIIARVKTAISATAVNLKERETKSVPNKRTYKVVPGDSLSRIARKMYGDASKWGAIYNANKDKIKNPNIIKVGQVFTIPNAPKSSFGSKPVKPKVRTVDMSPYITAVKY